MLDADFLDRIFYHNELRTWLVAAAVMAGVVFGLAVLRRVLLSRLERLALRTKTHFDDLVVDLLRRTSFMFRVFLALTAGSLVLALPSGARAAVRTVAVLALLIQVGAWGNGIIAFFTKRHLTSHAADGTSSTTITAMSYAARLLLYVILFLLALSNLGIDITALVAGLGIGGIAVALAVQNILGDLFGALSIVLDKPFVVGDAISVDQFSGTVEHIGLKSTRLRATTGEQLILSNADLLRSRVRNYKRMYERRVDLVFGVQYDTAPDLVARIPEIVREIIGTQPLARFDRAHFRGFGESALQFETVYVITVPDYNKMMDIQQAVNLELLRRFAADGIAFAFPTRTVVVQGGAVLAERVAAE